MAEIRTDLNGLPIGKIVKVGRGGSELSPPTSWDLLFYEPAGALLDSFHYVSEEAANAYAAEFGIVEWDESGLGLTAKSKKPKK